MSQENVEVVRALNAAFNAGGMDAMRDLYDPNVVMYHVKDWPEPGPTVGRETVMRFIEQLRDTWDADTIEVISDYIHAADRVVVRWIWHGRGHGPQSSMELTTVSSVRNGKIREIEFFWDHHEALEAVGLSG
jgi:ketosteroid isomerase-like protein